MNEDFSWVWTVNIVMNIEPLKLQHFLKKIIRSLIIINIHVYHVKMIGRSKKHAH